MERDFSIDIMHEIRDGRHFVSYRRMLESGRLSDWSHPRMTQDGDIVRVDILGRITCGPPRLHIIGRRSE